MQSSSNTMPYSNPNQCQPFLRSDIHEAHDNYHGHDDSVNPHGTRSSKLSSSMTFSTTSQADYHGLTFTSIKKSLSLLLLVGFVVTIIMMFLPNWTLASEAAAAADTQVQHLSYNLVTEQKQEENIIHESSSSSFSYNHDVYPLFQTQQRILNNNNNNPTDIFCSNAQYTAISDLSYTYYLETTIGGNTNNNNNTSDDIIVDTIIQKVESSILNDLADTILFCRRSDDAGSESGNGQTRHRQTKQGRRIQEMSTMKQQQQRRQHDDDKRQIQSIHTSSSSSSLLERSYVGGEVGEENENGNDNDESFIDSLIDQYSLKIVGISSMPKDTPSTKSICIPSSTGNDCTVVIGALNLFLEDNADLPYVRYATRYAIREAMLSNKYVSDIEGLVDLKYVGPRVVKPSKDTDSTSLSGYDDFVGGDVLNNNGTGMRRNSNLTRLEVVVIVTLISTIIGLFGSFLLFKRVYSNQNCLAQCDGTGIDKDYVDDCNNLGITSVGESRFQHHQHGSMSSPSGKSSKGGGVWDNMNPLSSPSHNRNALVAIDENSVNTCDNGSLYSGTVSSKSIAMYSVGSIHSEQTQVISNGRKNKKETHCRTPSFGDRGDKENFYPSDASEMI